jgi:hypothetical protein
MGGYEKVTRGQGSPNDAKGHGKVTRGQWSQNDANGHWGVTERSPRFIRGQGSQIDADDATGHWSKGFVHE